MIVRLSAAAETGVAVAAASWSFAVAATEVVVASVAESVPSLTLTVAAPLS